MLIKYNDDFSINVNYPYADKFKHTILFIHGFTCSSDYWNDVISNLGEDILCVTYDLPGHGKTTIHTDDTYYTLDFQLKLIDFIIDFFQIKNFGIYGYSMGGRIALNYAIKNKVDFLILESTNPGLESEDERNLRYVEDKKIVEFIESHSVKEFIDVWMAKDLFKDLSSNNPNMFNKIKTMKYHNNKTGLIKSLLGMSQGIIKPVWEELENLDIPVLLLSGSEDEKYTKIHKKMNKLLPNAQNISIKGVSHNIHLSKPDVLAQYVKAFLANL